MAGQNCPFLGPKTWMRQQPDVGLSQSRKSSTHDVAGMARYELGGQGLGG